VRSQILLPGPVSIGFRGGSLKSSSWIQNADPGVVRYKYGVVMPGKSPIVALRQHGNVVNQRVALVSMI